MVLEYEHSGNKRNLTQPQENWNTLGDAVQEAHEALVAADVRMDAMEATLAAFGAVGIRNLVVVPGATPTTQVALTAGILAIEGAIRLATSVTADITVAGKNGLDTGSRATNTWYYVWVGFNPTTEEVCGMFSLTPDRGALTLSHASLSGFTKWKRVGSRKTNATSGGQFLGAYQQDHVVLYDAGLTATRSLSSGAGSGDTTWTTATLGGGNVSTSYVHPLVVHAYLTGEMTASGGAGAQLLVRPNGSSSTGQILTQVGASVDLGAATKWVPMNGSQQIQWAATNPSSNSIYVAGYYDPIG